VSLTTSGAMLLAASTIGRDLTLVSGGSITQNGVLTVPGTTSITSTAANSDVTLSQANNLGTMTFGGTLANIRDLNLRNVNASAALPTNLASLSSLRHLTLQFDNAAIAFPAISNSGNLSVIAGGAISQSGALTVSGTSSFNAGSNAITLTQNNSFTGAITLTNSGSNNVSVTNNRATLLAASSVGNNLTITSNGAITQNGALTVPGTSSFSAGANAITLTQNNALTGAVTLSNSGTNDVSLTTSGAMLLAASTIGRDLTLVSGGSITQNGVLTVPGTTSITSTATNSDVTLSQANDLGTITFGGTLANFRDFNLRNINASAALPTNLASLSNLRNLTLQFDNAPITQSTALTVSGTSSFNAGSNAITLTENNSFTGAITLTNSGSNNVSVTNNRATLLAASSVGNNLTITSSGAITQNGALTVPGTSSFSAGANAITLTQNNALTGAVTLSNSGTNDVSLTTSGAMLLAASTTGRDLTLVSGGSITQNGVLTVTGTTSIASTAANSDVTLSQANDLGTITFGGTLANFRDFNLHNINTSATLPTNLASLSNLRNLTLQFDNAPITQSAALTVSGTSSFNAGSNAITLTENNSFTGAITLTNSGSNNVSVTNNRATLLAASSVGNNLTITSNGEITQNGALTVPGTSSFSAGANAITLTQNNALTGAVTLSNSGTNDVSLTTSGAMLLAASTIGHDLTLVSGGSITQNGVLTVSGATSITATAANSDVTLSQANDLGTITFGGTLANFRDFNLRNINASATLPTNLASLSNLHNLSIQFDNAPISFPAINGSGNLTVTAGGEISQTGPLTIEGTSNFNAGNHPIILTKDNTFTGAISLVNNGNNNIAITNSVPTSLVVNGHTVVPNINTTLDERRNTAMSIYMIINALNEALPIYNIYNVVLPPSINSSTLQLGQTTEEISTIPKTEIIIKQNDKKISCYGVGGSVSICSEKQE
jgi:precorrin-2 methylase